jgi:hypothetical protein
MLLKCRICKHEAHDSQFWPKDVWVILLWWSTMALYPVRLARESRRYILLPIVLLPIVLLGALFWLLRQAVVGLAETFTYVKFRSRPCPTCGKRRWTWPILDFQDTVM